MCQPAFELRQQAIGDQREGRSADASDNDGDPVFRLQPAEDIVAEARLADGRRQCRRADSPDTGGPQAAEEDRRCERYLDAQQALPRRHANALRGLDDVGINLLQARDAAAQDRQHRIERQRDQGGKKSESGNRPPRYGLGQYRQPEQQGIEQGHQCQAGDRLDDTGNGQQGCREARAAGGQQHEWAADQQRQPQRTGGQQDVLRKIIRQEPQGCNQLVMHRAACRPHSSGHGCAAPAGGACRAWP